MVRCRCIFPRINAIFPSRKIQLKVCLQYNLSTKVPFYGNTQKLADDGVVSVRNIVEWPP